MLPAKLQTYLVCGAPSPAAAGGESARVINEARCGILAAAVPAPPVPEDMMREYVDDK